MIRITVLAVSILLVSPVWSDEPAFTREDLRLRNTMPPLVDPDDPRSSFTREPEELPLRVAPHVEHVRGRVGDEAARGPVQAVATDGQNVYAVFGENEYTLSSEGDLENPSPAAELPEWIAPRLWRNPHVQQVQRILAKHAPIRCRDAVTFKNALWIATDSGLFHEADGVLRRYERYGVEGPLATTTTALAVVGEDLWVGTPLGISICGADGSWQSLRGADGLPYDDVTAIFVEDEDNVWIGTTRGAILHKPHDDGRQWYYRAGQRYLPGDHVHAIAATPDGRSVYFATNGGLGRIDRLTRTLGEKAAIIEARVNERHRRLGLVAACELDDAHNPTSHTIRDFDNDGLWTSYHVAAMALAYAVTGDAAAKTSAREGMHALYMLQDASGTPGLVARSVLPLELGRTKGRQWRPTPDGTMYWKSDTSSDEIDGHYFAFYTYWEHVAKNDPAERDRLIEQVREVTDYLVDNDYLLIDWDGERTRWGFWNPKLLNEQPMHYLENGLNSLQMLSFLKVAHYITGDRKYERHYRKLITDHGYLDNVLLEKKVFPDENNHSDNQLATVAFYPILQLEHDPLAREALRKAARRHYKTIADDKSSFFYFVFATIDPHYVALEEAIENLQEIPTDRRAWAMANSHRTDVIFDPRVDRFGDAQLLHVLPADERNFEKWNKNLYLPDGGGDGRVEDDGAAYLLPYWMGRYHGFFEELPGTP